MSSGGIHPSAIVDARAEIGADARIGAGSVIGPGVRLDAEVEIGHHVVLEGRVSVGPRTRIGHGAIVGTAPQDLKFKDGTLSGVRIGADTTLREYATVHRASHDGEWTTIGNRCLVMAMAHVAHDCQLEDDVILINYAALTGHCHVGERATIGGYSGTVPFMRIGAFAYVGGLTKITADVPPFCMVDGNPATAHALNLIGLRRAGVSGDDRRILKAAFRILYRSGLTPARALERIREEVPATAYVRRLTEFLETARRGIVRGVRGEPPGEPSEKNPKNDRREMRNPESGGGEPSEKNPKNDRREMRNPESGGGEPSQKNPKKNRPGTAEPGSLRNGEPSEKNPEISDGKSGTWKCELSRRRGEPEESENEPIGKRGTRNAGAVGSTADEEEEG